MTKHSLIFSVAILLSSFHIHAQIISTYAGNNAASFAGDGGAATMARINRQLGVTTDAAGNVYIADTYNNRIRKVSTAGVITTIAGNGTAGFSGDGGPATNAGFYNPYGVAIDASGNIYFSDNGNNRVRKINTSGMISTFAGNGTAYFSGDGGQASAAAINQPAGLAVDAAGNVYIADLSNQRIRKVNTAGIISTVAGNGMSVFSGDGGAATLASLHQPSGVAVDATGNIYIADQINSRIRKVSPAGIINTIAGNGTLGYGGDGGPATAATLYQPSDVFVDAAGNVFMADMSNSRIRKISTAGIITTVSGTGAAGFSGDGGPATVAQVYNAACIAGDAAGNLYISDGNNNRIRMVNASGIIATFAGSGAGIGDGGPATAAMLYAINSIAFDAAGNLYVTDETANRIRKITPAGIISTFAGTGIAGFSGDGGPATAANIYMPEGVACDAAGNIYFIDANNGRVRKVNAAGIISTVAGTGLLGFSGDGGPATNANLMAAHDVVVDAAGVIYIDDSYNQRVRKVDLSGTITTVAGNGTSGYSGDGGPATAAELNDSYNIWLNPGGELIIADLANHVVRKVNTAGIISTIAGTGTSGYSGDGGPATGAMFSWVAGVVSDPLGNVYVCDGGNRIRMVNPSGIVSTIAGTGTFGYTGDGGPATAATLHGCIDVAFDAFGNLYIADRANGVIRKISASPTLGVGIKAGNVQNIRVFPNPAKDEITVTADRNINNIRIIDLSGQTVFTQAYGSSPQARMNIRALASGMYIVVVNESYLQKIVKE